MKTNLLSNINSDSRYNKDPFLRLSVPQIIIQARLKKPQTLSKQTVWPLRKAEPKRGIQPTMKLKVNTKTNIDFLEEQVSKFKMGNIRNCSQE